MDPSTSDFNPQAVKTASAAVDRAQNQLLTLRTILAGEPATAPFTRPLRRLVAATRRLQDAATRLHAAVTDLRTGRATDVATTLATASNGLRRATNALNRTQVLLGAICAAQC